jgi:pyrroline-5-carboxylate reductase
MAKRISKKVGFIGAGQMAEALARGFVKRGVVEAGDIYATDPAAGRKDVFKSFGTNAVDTSSDVVKSAEVVFIAVKPQYVTQVLQEVKQHLTDRHIIVSIAAGIPLQTLKDGAGGDKRLIRVMPNTPCLVGETASAMCLGGAATSEDADVVQALFSAVGVIHRVDEKLLSAVTGLSGSGPAYIFLMIEALADGGVRAGLPRDIAQQLAAQTVMGSAKMVLETGKHPGVLKDMVTSPAGTTIAGVHELERAGIRAAFMNAVLAASNRADELSKL